MSFTEKPKIVTNTTAEPQRSSDGRTDECAGSNDPLRKALCRVCGMPVMGAVPFCKNHEPPVP